MLRCSRYNRARRFRVFYVAMSSPRVRDIGMLFLRASFGLQMAFLHGFGKLESFADKADTFADPLGIGNRTSMAATVAAEFFCALLFAVGLGTRVAAFGLAFTMGIAAFVVHGGSPWAKKELALVYMTVALFVLAVGAGRLSIDHVVRTWYERRRDRRAEPDPFDDRPNATVHPFPRTNRGDDVGPRAS